MWGSNNFINSIGKYPIGLGFFVGMFNVIRVSLIISLLQKTDQKKNLEKHWFLKPQGMSLTKNSNQAILPGVGEHDLFLYAISKVIICNFV